MNPPLLEARAAGRRFRSRSGAETDALREVSLVVPRGSFVVVTGPSGGGKTTLLSLLAALDRPTSGAIVFDGAALTSASEAELARVRRRIGIVFQQSMWIRGLPLWENVTYPLVPRGVGPKERHRLAAELLARVGLSGREQAHPEELSGGEAQRAGIARALAVSPEALLADEPTSDLDRANADAIVALFAAFHRAGGTVVVASHDPAFLALATDTCALRHGRRER